MHTAYFPVVRSTLRYSAPASLSALSGAIYERIVLINLSWLSLVASVPLCIIFRELFLYFAPSFDDVDAVSASSLVSSSALSVEFAHCVSLYALASFLELASEPLYVWFQKQQRVRMRVIIDAAAVMVRCVVTFACMKYGVTGGGGGLLAFAYGQLAFAGVVLAGYYGAAVGEMVQSRTDKKKDAVEHATDLNVFTSLRDLLPQRLPTIPESPTTPAVDASLLSPYTDPALLRLTTQLTYQSLEKFALTEGEKMVLVSLNSNLDAQGVYGLVQNLGSLAARLLLQPIEESAFMEFSRLFADVTLEKEKTDLGQVEAASSPAHSATTTAASRTDAYAAAVRMLGALIHLVLLIGLVLMCFGPSYAYVFLDLLYGAKWSSTSAPRVLAYYCVYICFMALNGVTESFVSGVISTRQLRAYNMCLVAFSAVYLAACALLLPYGSGGLVAANCVNMAMRIAYSVWFIGNFFREAPTTSSTSAPEGEATLLRQLCAGALPDAYTALALLLSLATTALSYVLLGIDGSHSLARFALHILVGVVCLALVAFTMWRRERTFLHALRDIAGKRKRKMT